MAETAKPRTVSEILADFDEIGRAQAAAILAHGQMTPAQCRAAEDKLEARTGSRIFHVEDIVAANESKALEGYYLVDLVEA